MKINALKKIPLGNYVENLVNVKGSATGERIATARQNEQIIQSLNRKRKGRNWHMKQD